MRDTKHSYAMVALVVVGGVLFFAGVGVGGGGVFVLWLLACVAMMVAMMWGMRGMGRPAQHTHPDGVTHSHDEGVDAAAAQHRPHVVNTPFDSDS